MTTFSVLKYSHNYIHNNRAMGDTEKKNNAKNESSKVKNEHTQQWIKCVFKGC